MKVLVFSDLHLHNHVYGSELKSRLQDGADVMKQVAEYCSTNLIDHVVFGGDLFHTHGKIDASVLKVAYEGMAAIKEQVPDMFALVGNHDTSDKTMKVHSMHWLKALDIEVVDKPTHDAYGMSYLPYTEDSDAIRRFFGSSGDICFLHQGMDGVAMGSGFVPNSTFTLDMVPDHVRHVFTGHYHKHLKVDPRVTVIGSALQINWADKAERGDKRGFLVFDTEEDPGSFEFIETVAPKFVIFNMSGRGSADYIYQERLGKTGLFRDNFVRVINYNSTYTFEIREGLLDAGARSVEFVAPDDEIERLKKLHPLGGMANDAFNIPAAVEEYEKQKDVTEDRSKIGKEIMG
jgi:DNA repair exonuclease SbcCD nuclease subunit